MADGPALALQAALVAALRADAGVSALVGARVYDKPPHAANLTFPYVRIGPIILSPLRMSGDCVDDEIGFGIEAYSRPVAGRVEAARIAQAIREALDGVPFAVTGFNLDWCNYLTQAVSEGSDGESYVATVAFEAALSDA